MSRAAIEPPGGASWRAWAERRLVLGTWGLAGALVREGRSLGYGSVSRDQAMAVLDRAWDLGIRLLDTAPAYGDGEGLERIAGWQRSRGVRWRIALKPGRAAEGARVVSRLEPRVLVADVEAQAERVGAPAAILLKDPPPSSLLDGSAEAALHALAEAFPAASMGIASHDLASCRRLRTGFGLASPIAQIEYHGVNWPAAAPAARALREAGWTVWGMQPLCYGFLAPGRPRRFAADGDWRAHLPADTVRSFEDAAAGFLDGMRQLGVAAPAPRLALAFVLAQDSLARIVVGPKTVQQLDDVLAAGALAREAAVRSGIAALGLGAA